MRVPSGSFVDPPPQQFNLMLSEFPVRCWRRHAQMFFLRADSLKKSTLGGFARNDDLIATSIGKRTVFGIESQSHLLCLLIRSVAGEAGVRKNGANILVKIYRFLHSTSLSDACYIRVDRSERRKEHRRHIPGESMFQETPPSA